MQPKVSILVPIYKVPEIYLRTCIESLINQTLKEIEIILVDDGSPDKCGKICDEYAALDNRVIVIHKANGGLAAARNSAYDCAKGEYITFIDGDDFLEQDACELGYVALKENDVELVFWNQITEYNNSSKEIKTFGNDDIFFDKEACKELQIRVLDFNGRIAQVFSKMIKKDYLDKYNIRHIDDLRQGAEGFVFNIQLFNHLESAYYLSKPLLHYRYNEQSISHTPNEKNYFYIIKCFEWIKEYIKNCDNSKELLNMLYNRILYVVVTTAITGYFNPQNNQSFNEKKVGLLQFVNQSLIQESLKKASLKGLGIKRIIIITLVKIKCFWVLDVLGKIRRYELGHK